jgi:6-phosphofructokinase
MNTLLELPQTTFSQTIVTDIELKNGKNTQIITVFNNQDINFEEVSIGIDTAIKRQVEFYKNIKSAKHTLCSIKTGILKPFIFYDKVEFN